ncbi:MAG TPA: hypothetical protein VFT22_33200 [Kofleriaceae bacterium]|nr:hypothetical protein [Kofleriaceae bacterium]
MKVLFVLVVVLAGCSEGREASLDDLTIGCKQLDGRSSLDSGADFAPAVPGTLRGWDPDGRWFLTGVRVGGVSSYHFQRTGSQVIVDRNPAAAGRIDDTELFARVTTTGSSGASVTITTRVSNLSPDGTARAERAVCGDGGCTVCTARLVRATHNADEGEADHLALLGQLNDPSWDRGYTFNVRVDGTLAYLIRQDGLHIIETVDPAHPVELGHYRRTGEGYSNDVKLVDAGARRFALIADTPVDVVDVTDPALPVLAAQIPEGAHTLFTETQGATTLAYLGSYDGTCPVYDVTDPAQPRKLGSFNTGATILHDLSVSGGIAYLSAWEKGLLVVDFTSPAAPVVLGSWQPTPTRTSHSNWTTVAAGRRIALHGEEAFDAKLDIVDVEPASATFMQPFASWQTRPWISIHNIMAFGSKAYFTYYQDGVRVLDVSDPAHPQQLGYYNTWDPQADYASSAFFEGAVGLDVDLARKLVLVADSPRGLLILRDDTPAGQ